VSRTKLDFSASELFTFSRLEPVRVLDLQHRLTKAGVPDDEKGRSVWAKAQLAGKTAVGRVSDLSFDYAKHLKDDYDVSRGLLGRDDLREAEGFDGAKIAQNPDYREDHRRAQATFLAMAIDPSRDDAAFQDAARLLQFVERFPRLSEERLQPFFAPVLRRRTEDQKRRGDGASTVSETDPQQEPLSELNDLVATLRTVWRERDAEVSRLRTAYLDLRSNRAVLLREAMSEAAKSKVVSAPAKSPAKNKSPAQLSVPHGSTKTADREKRMLRAQAASAARNTVKAKIETARRAYQNARSTNTLAAALSRAKGQGTATTAAPYLAIDKLKDLIAKHKLPADHFCQLYALVLEKIDLIDRPRRRTGPYPIERNQTWDAPAVGFSDAVRMLGKAELVRVEEEFVGYSSAEISYIQTVMPGEQRMRKTRSANVQETILEELEDDQTERLDESSATTKSELKSEIETELQSRFASSVSASGSGEGGGSIGVVNFSGGGSVNAGLDLGLDTGLRTSNESQFAQEVLRKAVERTNRRTMERRLTRTRQSFSASDVHQITNSTDKPINGTYVFLNKQVAITETVYGVRAFMEAKLLAPGRSLIAARRSQQRAVVDEFGDRPRFDLTPADITPANYMLLAGRFRASNVDPPPKPITRLTRVYKTDSASATSDLGGGADSQKIADILVPFFGKYQRFAITDNIDLPEGYEVLDVDVAVSHGANGVSIPAHLPLTLPATALYAGLSFTPFVMGILGIAFLPAWVWSVGKAASPLLHYNTDSSNVTVTIGTEGQDSAYYFFEPDDMLDIVTELLTAISSAAPQFLQNIQTLALQRIAEARTAASRVPAEIAREVQDAINGSINQIRAVLDALIRGDAGGALAAVGGVGSASMSLNLTDEIRDVFRPLTDLIGDLAEMVQDEVGEAIQFALGQLLSRLENNQKLEFTSSRGMEGTLPIAINALALNPGVTANLSACLMRTPEGLARWQLRTFEQFYQAYLQQVAAYENQYYSSALKGQQRSSGNMRREERIALKERVINALHALHPTGGTTIPIERLELFEHAIDWDSMSYRLFNYGPSDEGMALELEAVLTGGDEERRRFLLSTWSQAMIPLQPHDGLVAQFLDYLRDGSGSVADAISGASADVPETDELTALYRDLVLSRSLIDENPPSGEPRFVTLPTDLIALFEPNLTANLPRNPAWP
jgi:hypothetical protein